MKKQVLNLVWALLALVTLQLDCYAADPVGDRQVYKTVDDQELSLYITKPDDWKPDDSRPAVLFFHGGGWVGGKVWQFNEHCRYFAARGMVCIQVQYRLIDKKQDETPIKSIQDAKSAMRWVRSRVKGLGIDPNRIASGGGSAGGHLAAFVGMMDGMDDPQDDLKVSARSDAMLLFNPVLDNGPGGFGYERVKERYPEYSPFHNVSSDDPPAIFFLGDQDTLIPVETAHSFQKKMKAAGIECEVVIFEGMEHGFFNSWKHDGVPYKKTIEASDRFLVGLGWLEGEPANSVQDGRNSFNRVFLLGGQSNMVGTGLQSELTPPYSTAQHDVMFWKNGWVSLSPGLASKEGRFGPETSFGRAIKDALPEDTIYLVKHAAGATALYDDWKPESGPQSKKFVGKVRAALSSLDAAGIDYEISGMLWMQGESDAYENQADAYETNLVNFINAMRSEFETPEMPFIIGRVLDYFGGTLPPKIGEQTEPTQAHIVRTAQVKVAESMPYTAWIDTDGYQLCTYLDEINNPGHYGPQGNIDLGKDFASAVLEFITNSE